MSNSRRSPLPLTVLLTGLSLTSILQLPQTAHSQQDYEELIITETNSDQKLDQKNTGSGSSVTTLIVVRMLSDSHLFEQISCSIEEEIPPTEVTAIKPVVTQREVEIPVVPSGTTSGEAQYNADEVVTGGGYEISELRSSGTRGTGGSLPPSVFIRTTFKEFAENNAWHIEVNPNLTGNVRVYAECLKLCTCINYLKSTLF